MIPISRGGKHCLSNIVLACSRCNSRKYTKTLVEWLHYIWGLQQVNDPSKDHLAVICGNLLSLIGHMPCD